MKVGIYVDVGSSGSSVGGAELSAAVLGQALGALHQVDLIHHNSAITSEGLSEFAGVDLRQVHLRFTEREKDIFGRSKAPWNRYREARSWCADLSAPYDLFVNFTHFLPAFCHAPKGILVVLFPWFDRHEAWPWKSVGADKSFLRGRLLQAYYDWEWRKRFSTYGVKMANSQYTQRWAKAWWGIDCDVVYPPVDCQFSQSTKKDVILSVGRFTTESHSKKQWEMVQSFAQIESAIEPGWKYFCVGGLSARADDQAYFDSVQLAARGLPACVRANLPRHELAGQYAGAKIFWHAAGYGEDEKTHPELQEHFGITTVEAMAAGCVPVVINRGGQPEIVQHGRNGFIWNTLDELKNYTLRLMTDEAMRSKMSDAARQRASYFERDKFVSAFSRVVQTYTAV